MDEMRIIKRDKTEVIFNSQKITDAVMKANRSVSEELHIPYGEASEIAAEIEQYYLGIQHTPAVEDVQDMVEMKLMERGHYRLAKNYITYRYEHARLRAGNTTDAKILSLTDCVNEEVMQENSNKSPVVNSTQRDYIAGETSRDITERLLLTPDIVDANRKGIIHFHDSDYFIQRMFNCCLINMKDMLLNGTVISDTMIESPHTFATACNIATQIIAQVASNQYGGQSFSLAHLAPFVERSRQKHRKAVRENLLSVGIEASDEQICAIAEARLKEEIKAGVQTIQYQINTLLTTNGQTPFVTSFMYLNEAESESEKRDLAMIIEETLKQRYQGVKNKQGVWITPSFPKLIYVTEDDNIDEGTPYYYLTQLAERCSAKRFVPDYISEKKMKELKEGNCFPVMGCRSALSPWKDENGEYKFYGRFNQGVVTLNLPDIALSSGGDMCKFWDIFDERLELCYKALMIRHNRLKGTTSDVSPIHWQHGAIARLQPGEKIDKYLLNGYSTISLGYAGLYECVKYMTGKSHTDPDGGTQLGLEILEHMNKACAKWKEETTIAFGIYGTPLESTTYKFAKCLKDRFGVIEDITDHNYITNSYHCVVREHIDAFTKLKFEAQFQHLSMGGAISYVEIPNMQNNPEAVHALVKFMHDNIMYAEMNTKSDYCCECGWDGEIDIVKDRGKLIWKCPKCGNTDQAKMSVVRRTCGYLGSHYWNQGRTEEIMDRVLHL